VTEKEVLQELRGLGTAQNRKVYRRHGVTGDAFGVSYANMAKLTKKIKTDHDLAQKLWSSGNHDARILATFIVDTERMDKRLINSWAKDLSNYVITDAFVQAVSRTVFAQSKMEQWNKAKNEWIASAGWQLLGYLAMNEHGLSDRFFEEYLTIIKRDIHSQKNRVRYAMNNALIAIGARTDTLEKKALSIADKIGKVVVDHGETNCKTPDARLYIPKAAARNRKRRPSTAAR